MNRNNKENEFHEIKIYHASDKIYKYNEIKKIRKVQEFNSLPWFHIVILIPCKLSACHEPQPHHYTNKAQLPLISATFCQLRCNIKPVLNTELY